MMIKVASGERPAFALIVLTGKMKTLPKNTIQMYLQVTMIKTVGTKQILELFQASHGDSLTQTMEHGALPFMDRKNGASCFGVF
jgi:hypothetical protein